MCNGCRRIVEKFDWIPSEFRNLPQREGRKGRSDVKQNDVSARPLQDLYLRVEGRGIGSVECSSSNDHTRLITEPLLQPFQQIPSELIVLPEHSDLAI